jgi:hypothetical protein
MAELLVRVVSKVNADPYLDVKCTKRGDVIAVCDDGWAWGPAELTNPDWRILKVPNLTVTDVQGFLAPEPEVNPAHPSRMLQRRAFKLDMSNVTLPAALWAWVQDSTRAVPTRTLNVTLAQLLALKVLKPALPDPNVMLP